MALSSQRLRQSLEDAAEDLELDASVGGDRRALEQLLSSKLKSRIPRDTKELPFQDHLNDDEYLHILATTLACQDLEKLSATKTVADAASSTMVDNTEDLTREQKALAEECSGYLQQDYERRRQQMYQRLEVLQETFGHTKEDAQVCPIPDHQSVDITAISSQDLLGQFLRPSSRGLTHVSRPDTATGTTDRGGRIATSESRQTMPAFETGPKKKASQSSTKPNKSGGAKSPKARGKGNHDSDVHKEEPQEERTNAAPKKPLQTAKPNKSAGANSRKGKGKRRDSSEIQTEASMETSGTSKGEQDMQQAPTPASNEERSKDQGDEAKHSSEQGDKHSGEAKTPPTKKKNNRNRKRKPKNTNANTKP